VRDIILEVVRNLSQLITMLRAFFPFTVGAVIRPIHQDINIKTMQYFIPKSNDYLYKSVHNVAKKIPISSLNLYWGWNSYQMVENSSAKT